MDKFICIPYVFLLNISQVLSFARTSIELLYVIQLPWWKSRDQKIGFLLSTLSATD